MRLCASKRDVLELATLRYVVKNTSSVWTWFCTLTFYCINIFWKKLKYNIKPNFSKDIINFFAFLKKNTMTKSSHFLSQNGQGFCLWTGNHWKKQELESFSCFLDYKIKSTWFPSSKKKCCVLLFKFCKKTLQAWLWFVTTFLVQVAKIKKYKTWDRTVRL